eukprot:CAMPEP_0168383302 /NCGR_PEP_ID=MMETSP0228-20121227/13833_1 /TAXON_ID=133427 /ORGANISM="Protoceratium reticulatum, Strain CCCM 535 (=CCMP 1889)" /LENGTH=1159 /DNA_ID=CAMNT_0008396449 /DNA_START=91 /DNA_END=3569 /DNA_ORIENTATION=+
MAPGLHMWEVVGGADKGGVLVRRGKEMTAAKEAERLSTGALVKQVELDDKRLHFVKLTGTGPKSGWVSIEISNKELLVPSSKAAPEGFEDDDISTDDDGPSTTESCSDTAGPPAAKLATKSEEESHVTVRDLGTASECEANAARWSLADVLCAADSDAPSAQTEQEPAAVEDWPPARRARATWRAGADYFFSGHRDLLPTFGYVGSFDERPPFARFDVRDKVCLRIGGFTHGQVVRDSSGSEFVAVGVKCLDGTPRLFFQPADLGRPGVGSFPAASAKELRALLSAVPDKSVRRLREASHKDFDEIEDSDEEVLFLCKQCRLPLGSSVYVDSNGEGERHAECMATLMLQKVQQEEEERRELEETQKAKGRVEHDIGWRADRIPRNSEHMRRLGYWRAQQHMSCLVLEEREEGELSVRVSETVEPAGSVNLEYLSLALLVRLREGAEPAFSLDPTSGSDDPEKTQQEKRFEPAWLAGTSAGDVLFQSDYYLKELSMGEHDQPVIGMKSAFDFSEEEGHKTEWRAREWFVVRDARIRVSEDSVLIPQVKMGIEAREQHRGADGIEDSLITRPDHPLVKYADMFSHHFDLIAERKSAIYHLRELAKASILAKYLLEARVSLKDAWFQLAGAARTGESMVLPQLWSDRCHSQVRVQDGKIVEADTCFDKQKHCVYGGVEFGLDRFSISRPTMASGALLARGASASMQRVLGVTSVRQLQPSLVGQPLRAGIEAQAQIQGVDLDLSKFDLTAPSRDEEGPAASWGRNASRSLDSGAAIGGAFWSNISPGSGPLFKDEDKLLLREIYDPYLSDRRDDGDLFVPPDTSFSYVQNLRRLVAEERRARQCRKDHFFSSDFVVGNAGPFFPSAWTSSFELSRGQVLQRVHQGAHPRPEQYRTYTGELPQSLRNLGALEPAFDRAAEDGTRFRIYRSGGLEVRTTQEPDGKESIGVVFLTGVSTQVCEEDRQPQRVNGEERVAKVTEYVESAIDDALRAKEGGRQPWPHARNSYITFETEDGNVMVTEMLKDGTVTWEANPAGLEDRNLRARVVRAATSFKTAVSIRDIAAFRAKAARLSEAGASSSDRKHFTQVAYNWAMGQAAPGELGLLQPDREDLLRAAGHLGFDEQADEEVFFGFRCQGSAQAELQGNGVWWCAPPLICIVEAGD